MVWDDYCCQPAEGKVERGRAAAAAALTWTLVALRATTLVMEEAMQAILKSGMEVVKGGECVQEWRTGERTLGCPLGRKGRDMDMTTLILCCDWSIG